MKTRRLQVLIEEDQFRRLSAAAQARGVSVATVVREALDRTLSVAPDERRVAAARILEALPMPVPDVDQLLRELDELRGRHG